jgi:hypothetical protein
VPPIGGDSTVSAVEPQRTWVVVPEIDGLAAIAGVRDADGRLLVLEQSGEEFSVLLIPGQGEASFSLLDVTGTVHSELSVRETRTPELLRLSDASAVEQHFLVLLGKSWTRTREHVTLRVSRGSGEPLMHGLVVMSPLFRAEVVNLSSSGCQVVTRLSRIRGLTAMRLVATQDSLRTSLRVIDLELLDPVELADGTSIDPPRPPLGELRDLWAFRLLLSTDLGPLDAARPFDLHVGAVDRYGNIHWTTAHVAP